MQLVVRLVRHALHHILARSGLRGYGSLLHLVHSRKTVRVVIAVLSLFIKILLQKLPFRTHLRNSGPYDHNTNQRIVLQIDSLAENSAHHAEAKKRLIIVNLVKASKEFLPLFFLHAIFQGIFQAPLFQVLGAALPGQVFTIANLTVTVEIALCILCILGIKKVMGKRSRYLIGG